MKMIVDKVCKKKTAALRVAAFFAILEKLEGCLNTSPSGRGLKSYATETDHKTVNLDLSTDQQKPAS